MNNLGDEDIQNSYLNEYDETFNENTYENNALNNTVNTTPYNFANSIRYDTLKKRVFLLRNIDEKIDILKNTDMYTESNNDNIIKDEFSMPKIKLSFNKFIILSFFIFIIILLIIIYIVKKKDTLPI
jgi:hypothetical protein